MNFFLLIIVSFLLPLVYSVPSFSQTAYLLIKSEVRDNGVGVSIHSVPMTTLEQCEEAGAILIASSRFDTRNASRDGFECVEGK
jgi:hypothetical protein